MDEFSDFKLIPSVLEQPQAMQNGVTLTIGPNIRFLFRTDDGRWTVNFANERIDVLHTKNTKESPDLDGIGDFIDNSLRIFGSINSRFVTEYSRLSLVTRYILLDGSRKDVRDFFEKRFAGMKFYSENDPEEWGFRVNARKDFQFKNDEGVNVITQMNCGKINVRSETEIEVLDGGDSHSILIRRRRKQKTDLQL